MIPANCELLPAKASESDSFPGAGIFIGSKREEKEEEEEEDDRNDTPVFG